MYLPRLVQSIFVGLHICSLARKLGSPLGGLRCSCCPDPGRRRRNLLDPNPRASSKWNGIWSSSRCQQHRRAKRYTGPSAGTMLLSFQGHWFSCLCCNQRRHSWHSSSTQRHKPAVEYPQGPLQTKISTLKNGEAAHTYPGGGTDLPHRRCWRLDPTVSSQIVHHCSAARLTDGCSYEVQFIVLRWDCSSCLDHQTKSLELSERVNSQSVE